MNIVIELIDLVNSSARVTEGYVPGTTPCDLLFFKLAILTIVFVSVSVDFAVCLREGVSLYRADCQGANCILVGGRGSLVTTT